MKKLIILVLTSVLLFTGCQSKTTPVLVVSEPSTPPINISVPAPSTNKTYAVKVKIPLYCADAQVGYVRINKITKLRFADFTNDTAINNSIKYSYSVNATLKVRGLKQSTGLTFEPVIKNQDGIVISSIANVGWTGFSTKMDFYGGKGMGTIEIGLQPLEQVNKKSSFGLKISDSEGHRFNFIRLNKSCLTNAKRGPSLKQPGKNVLIRSVNGSAYYVTPRSCYFETNYVNVEDHNKGFEDLYLIEYRVNAVRFPTNRRTVKSISGHGKRANLNGACVLGLQCQMSSKVLYECYQNAGRLNYSDYDSYYPYVYEGKKIRFGKYEDCTTNRIPEMGMSKPDYVRVRVEFPDEIEARKTLKEKLSFNGRFLVYELEITDRKLGKYFK